MVKVEEEEKALRAFGVERCCMCRKKTTTWFTKGDVALCQECADHPLLQEHHLPTKKCWCGVEDLLSAIGREIPADCIAADTKGIPMAMDALLMLFRKNAMFHRRAHESTPPGRDSLYRVARWFADFTDHDWQLWRNGRVGPRQFRREFVGKEHEIPEGITADTIYTPGRDALWEWFGLSRASWLVLPRAFLHQLPDELQHRLAVLLTEIDEFFPRPLPVSTTVRTVNDDGRLVRTPDYITNYRHPDVRAIMSHRTEQEGK